ncbi:MAG: hypothetical protein ABIC68_08035 [Candidatus Omnitrophota bacterium]
MKRFVWVFAFGLFFVLALYNIFSYEYALQGSLESLRNKLKTTATNVSNAIDAETLLKIPLKTDADKTDEYKTIYNFLLDMKGRLPDIKYIYIMTATDQPGILKYVVDADPLPEIATAKGPTAFAGDEYDARNVPALLDAFKGSAADEEFVVDDWGATLSGYAPIYDKGKNVVAILGVDMDASQLHKTREMTQKLLIIVLITGIMFLISVVFFCFKAVKASKEDAEAYS